MGTCNLFCLQSDLDHEYRAHKIDTIRLMYEQVAEEYEVSQSQY